MNRRDFLKFAAMVGFTTAIPYSEASSSGPVFSIPAEKGNWYISQSVHISSSPCLIRVFEGDMLVMHLASVISNVRSRTDCFAQGLPRIGDPSGLRLEAEHDSVVRLTMVRDTGKPILTVGQLIFPTERVDILLST